MKAKRPKNAKITQVIPRPLTMQRPRRSVPVRRVPEGRVALIRRPKSRPLPPRKKQELEVALPAAKITNIIEENDEQAVPVRIAHQDPPHKKKPSSSPESPKQAAKQFITVRRKRNIVGSSVAAVAAGIGMLAIILGCSMAFLPGATLLFFKSLMSVAWLKGTILAFLDWQIGPLATDVIEATRASTIARIAGESVIARPMVAGGQSLTLIGVIFSCLAWGIWMISRKRGGRSEE